MSSVSEFDIVFLSYDEPNAERHYADLCDKAPWVKRVHGVKGFDAAHVECARQAETDWFITVDADNIVRPEFFDQDVTLSDQVNCYSWNGQNAINGLCYGNGGLKLWRKDHVLTMQTHENADDPRHAVDFCWDDAYVHLHRTCSDVYNNGSPYQAFRVGFREGVKLSLDRGQRVTGEMMKSLLHPVNLRNLRTWSCVGAHVENGAWAVYGTRLAWSMMCDIAWDHTVVRDYDWFQNFWQSLEKGEQPLTVYELGATISMHTKIGLPLLNETESAFFCDMMALRND